MPSPPSRPLTAAAWLAATLRRRLPLSHAERHVAVYDTHGRAALELPASRVAGALAGGLVGWDAEAARLVLTADAERELRRLGALAPTWWEQPLGASVE